MDLDLRTLERTVLREPANGQAKIALWNAQLRLGIQPVPENPRELIPPVFDNYDWEEVFGAAGEEGRTVRKNIACVKHEHSRPGSVVPGDAISNSPFGRVDVRYVFAHQGGERDRLDWIALMLLWDGRFATISAGCDYSGWG